MTRDLTHLHIETGPGGWAKVRWRRKGVDENVVFVRMRPPQRKGIRWLVMGLHVSKDSNPPWLSADLARDVPLYRIDQAINASDVFTSGLESLIDQPVSAADLDESFRSTYREAPRHVLERPPRNKLDDAFFREVALAYRQAVAAGLPPIETLAAESDIPRGTINRWVAEARKPERGYLPAAEKGKVSV